VAFLAVFLKSGARGNSVRGISLTKINIVFVLGSLALAVALHLMKQTTLVPMWPIDGNPYSVLSAQHLIDVLNQLVLVAPLGVALLIFGALYGRRRAVAVGAEDAILGAAALLFFLTAFWVDPRIGAVRDWDLLSFYGIPLTLWGLLRFTKYFAHRQVGSGWLVAVSVLVLIGIGPNLYEKNNPESTLERLDRLVCNDMHYQTNYQLGDRCVAWVSVLQVGMGREDLAIKYLKRALVLRPQSHTVSLNLARIYFRMGELDSTLMYARKAQAANPNDPELRDAVTQLQNSMPSLDSALTQAESALSLDTNNVDAVRRLAVALSEKGQMSEALIYFRRAYELSPDTFEQIVNLGLCLGFMKMFDSALYYVDKAYPMAPASAKENLCCSIIAAALNLGRRNEAAQYLQELERLSPNSPRLPGFRTGLKNLPE
jgi:tetratricopeptide (TPR) repeat protein